MTDTAARAVSKQTESAAGRIGWTRALAVALMGAAAALGQAPLGLWPVSLAALAGLMLVLAAVPAREALVRMSFAAGFGYGAASLFWIVEPFLVDAARHAWMAPFALALMAAGMGAFWSLAGFVAARWDGRTERIAAFALALAGTELLRSHVFTGFPWALVGHIWIGSPVMQAAAFVGPIGLSLLTTLIAALAVIGRGPFQRGLSVGALALLLAGVWGAGFVRQDTSGTPRAEPMHVRLIQPNAAQHLKWQGDMWRVFLDRQMDMTAASADTPLDLIVWPETAVPFLLDNTGDLLAEMAGMSGGVPLAFGVQREDGLRFYNSLAVIDGAGRVTEVYDKAHLVPFGEYVPWGDAMARLGITAFAAQEGNGYSAGPGARVLDLGRLGKVLPLICYEAIFAHDINGAGGRPDWMLQITNDGWFGNIAGPYQHLAQARLRAVEQGVPVLRSANTGVSAVIDAKGRVLRSLPLNTEGFIDAELPPALAPTVYSRTGDWPALALILAGLLVLALVRPPRWIDRAAPRV